MSKYNHINKRTKCSENGIIVYCEDCGCVIMDSEVLKEKERKQFTKQIIKNTKSW